MRMRIIGAIVARFPGAAARPAGLPFSITLYRFMDMNEAASLYRLLGEEARLRLLRVLARERLNVTELTAVLGIAQSGVSRHLGLLKDAGLVAEAPAGGLHLLPARHRRRPRPPRGLWAHLQAQFAGRRVPGRPRRRGPAAGSAAPAPRELRHPRHRGRPARARPELGRLGPRPRPPAAAARRRRPRLRRGLPHHRGGPVGAPGVRHRPVGGGPARPAPSPASTAWRTSSGSAARSSACRCRRRRSTWRCSPRRCITPPTRPPAWPRRRASCGPAAARCCSTCARTISPG